MAERVSARRQLIGAAAVAVLALGAGGCALKGGQNTSLVQGKILFVKNCGRCHTLARADSTAEIGPNLDAAFAESISQGFGRSDIAGIVEQQIEYPNTAGLMPKLPLSTRQAANIADYVAYAAAKPGKDTGLLASAVSSGFLPPAVEKDGTLALEANPQGLLRYTVNKATATAGAITITMTNKSGIAHNLAIQVGTSGAVLKATPISATGTHSISLNLKPGNYTFFCEVPGHRAAGMLGTLTVK
jgi:plastocyanin